MTRQEVVNALRRWHYTRAGKRGITRGNLARLANVHEINVEMARKYGSFSDNNVFARLAHAVELIETGQVRFIRWQSRLPGRIVRRPDGTRGRAAPAGEPAWQIEHVRKPSRPPRQDRITRAGDHAPFARCRTCHGDQWTAIEMHGAVYYACDRCVPPAQQAGMGAVKINDQSRLALSESSMREGFP